MSNSSKKGGTFLWNISKKFQFAADKLIPDSLVFCFILTFIVFVLSMIFTGTDPIKMCSYWYDGLWTQASFAFQMALMVVVCATCAKSRQVKKLLNGIASFAKSPVSAMIILMIFGYVSSFINWAFCTVVTPILAMQLSKKIKGLHFPMMIAAGYSTMILGQCMGPSASVYALLASADHFLVDKIGVMSQNVTTYNPMNVVLWVILAVVTMLLAIATRPGEDELVEFNTALDDAENFDDDQPMVTVADKLNGSKITMWLIGAAGIIAIARSFIEKGFLGSLSVNFIIFIFLTLNCFLYNTPSKFVAAHKDNMKLSCEILIQFPFYGGISGMMTSSGFGQVIVNGIMTVASAQSMPVWAYLSASIVNLFIPSQGGQWIVQGPLLTDAAQSLGANMNNVVNAFVYGDEATNLLQPLYVIPALSVVGMKLKDVWGFMAFIWAFWFVITTIGLYIIPMFV